MEKAEDKREISLVVDADRLPAKRFITLVQKFLDLVQRVSAEVTSVSDLPEMEVRVEAGSQRVHLSTALGVEPAIAAVGYDAIMQGLHELESPETTQPPDGFDDDALAAARSIARAAISSGAQAAIGVGSGNRVVLTKQVVKTIDGVRAGGYSMWGSVEGRLEVINIHAKQRHCYIYRLRDDRRVRAVFDDERFESVRNHLSKRVIASGKLHYDVNDKLKFLDVHSIRAFKDDSELPTIDDVIGILGMA